MDSASQLIILVLQQCVMRVLCAIYHQSMYCLFGTAVQLIIITSTY